MIDNAERIIAHRLETLAARLCQLHPESWAWQFHAGLYATLYRKWREGCYQ